MSLTERLTGVRERIGVAATRAGRDPATIRLIAVSKLQPAAAIREALAAGQLDFGENYARELRDKAMEVEGARWHFLGAIQASNAPRIADAADWVHSFKPDAAGGRLARRAAAAGRSISVCIQVDLAGRGSGVAPEGLQEAIAAARQPGIEVCGLMTLPPVSAQGEAARPYFRRLAAIGSELEALFEGAPELSMGMSSDYEIAVEEGATMVRVGTAIFGERPVVQRP